MTSAVARRHPGNAEGDALGRQSIERARADSLKRVFQEVTDRLKLSLGVETNKEVALALGLSATNLGERKTRGAIPVDEIRRLCAEIGESAEWVLKGGERGANTLRVDRIQAITGRTHVEHHPINRQLLGQCIEVVELEQGRRDLRLTHVTRARLIGALYDMSIGSGRLNASAVGPLFEFIDS